MDRAAWIELFSRAVELRFGVLDARDLGITEFNVRCRAAPLDTSPELPTDQWPAPADAARDALLEYEAQED